jgi:hypothetical protein
MIFAWNISCSFVFHRMNLRLGYIIYVMLILFCDAFMFSVVIRLICGGSGCLLFNVLTELFYNGFVTLACVCFTTLRKCACVVTVEHHYS